MSSPKRTWSVEDAKFLRSLRIVADEPAPPSPRFVVEPGKNAGEFQVVDRLKRSGDHVFTKKAFKGQNLRAAAEDFARQMNEKHGEEQST